MTMGMDFGALPPEINSARMYAGPGSAPLVQAARAWGRLANELNATAASYSSVIAGLAAADWQGPSALSMAAAAAPYVAWMRSTAAQAEQAAAQAISAANAYESAHAAIVPPGQIAANRSTMLSLVRSNIFGQNTPAIATSEADYSEMWAQDIVAMDGYAGTSAAATDLAPFTSPPATTTGTQALSAATVPASAAAASPAETSILPLLQSFLPAPFNAIPNPFEDLDLLVLAAVVVSLGALGVSAIQLGEVYRHDVVDEDENAPVCGGEYDELPAAGLSNPDRDTITTPGGQRLASPPSPPIAALSGYSANIGGLSVPPAWNLPPAVRQVAAMFPGATPMYLTGGSDGQYPNHRSPISRRRRGRGGRQTGREHPIGSGRRSRGKHSGVALWSTAGGGRQPGGHPGGNSRSDHHRGSARSERRPITPPQWLAIARAAAHPPATRLPASR